MKNYNYQSANPVHNEADLVNDEESYDEQIEEFPLDTDGHNQPLRQETANFSHEIRKLKTISLKAGDKKGVEVDDLFMKNGYFQTNGEFSVKNSSHQDSYFKNMNEFVDDKLQIVVDKLAEKKALQSANNTLRVMLDKVGDEIHVLLKDHSKLSTQYDKEYEINVAKNKECDDLELTLSSLRERIERMRISENENINMLRDQYSDLKNTHVFNKQQLNLDKNVWNDELKAQRDDISLLEDENRNAHVQLKDYTSKYKYCQKLEKEKAEVFKEKNKILSQLVDEEKPVLKSNTNKRVFDITKEFCKQLDQRRISQAFDSRTGIVDLSSTKLFNTTFNSIKMSAIEKTYDSKEGVFRSEKRFSTGPVAKKGSSKASRL